MADPVSGNLDLLLMSTGTASGQWGMLLNSSVFTILDQVLGSTQSVSLSSTDVTLTITQRQNLAFNCTGTISANVNVILPLSPNSTTAAVGGIFVFDNETTGAFSVTVKTAASGSTGVAIPQSARSVLYSDGTNVTFADDTQNQTKTFNGNPNGNVAGKAGSVSTRTDRIIDRSTNTEYLCTTSGTASSAVWSVNLPYTFPSQGYLTASSDATNPILTGDSIGASTIYLTGINGNLVFIYNGISFVPSPITGGQMALALSSSSQAANGIYDVMYFLNGSTPTIAFSPAWSVATAGSCSRGPGAGTPQLTRINGIPVNAVQQTANNGSTTYTIAANRGTYVGSIFVDSTPGQVTCHRSAGQSRKFGIWSAYNRVLISLQVFDSTASWNATSTSWHPSNGSSNNSCTVFCGLPEEFVSGIFSQYVAPQTSNSALTGIGWNSISSPSGKQGTANPQSSSGDFNADSVALYDNPPFLGISTATCLEQMPTGGNAIMYGGASMRMTMKWNG